MPDEGRQDEQNERSVDEQIRAEVDKVTAAFQSKLDQQTEAFKGEIAGLNRRNSELENALKAKADETMTVEQQIQQLRDERRADQQASALREKRLEWRAKAAELHLDDLSLVDGIDSTKTLEDGVSYIEKLAGAAQNLAKALTNDTLAKAGYKPGSGATDHEQGAAPPDPSSLSFSDLNQMSDSQLDAIGRSEA